jgi:hypothetical protein
MKAKQRLMQHGHGASGVCQPRRLGRLHAVQVVRHPMVVLACLGTLSEKPIHKKRHQQQQLWINKPEQSMLLTDNLKYLEKSKTKAF